MFGIQPNLWLQPKVWSEPDVGIFGLPEVWPDVRPKALAKGLVCQTFVATLHHMVYMQQPTMHQTLF